MSLLSNMLGFHSSKCRLHAFFKTPELSTQVLGNKTIKIRGCTTVLCHKYVGCRRKTAIILENGWFSAWWKEMTGSFMWQHRVLNCNNLLSVVFSAPPVRNSVINEKPFVKDTTRNRCTHIFIYLMHAALCCFSASLCLLFPLSSCSPLFWFLFPLCSHPDIPNCSPKRQSLCCQLMLALLPRTEAKGRSGPFPFCCHWKKTPLYVGNACIYSIKNRCRKPASPDPNEPQWSCLQFLPRIKWIPWTCCS